MCAIIDHKSHEADDNAPWSRKNLIEGDQLVEELPQDFHQAVDANVSDKVLWEQIQNETKMRA